jgi:hypothetical protein
MLLLCVSNYAGCAPSPLQAAGYTWPEACAWEALEASAFREAAEIATAALPWGKHDALTHLLAAAAVRGAVGLVRFCRHRFPPTFRVKSPGLYRTGKWPIKRHLRTIRH